MFSASSNKPLDFGVNEGIWDESCAYSGPPNFRLGTNNIPTEQ